MEQETGSRAEHAGTFLFRFREFPVYRDARAFRLEVSNFCKGLPNGERFVLRSQLRRAADSILLNIAEGSNRRSDIDFSRFLNQALSSLEEVMAGFDIALDEQYINTQSHAMMMQNARRIGRQLLAFSATLKRGGQRLKF